VPAAPPDALAPLRLPAFPAPHGFTTRAGGVGVGRYATLNLGTHVGDDADAVAENRRRALRAAAADPARTAHARQVHGAAVLDAADAAAADGGREGDALVATRPGWTVVVTVADCVPVLLSTPDARAVAAVHAGWRGLVAGVVDAAVAALAARSGVGREALHAAVGPHAGAGAWVADRPGYQVGPEVVAAFADAGFPDAVARPDPRAAGRFEVSLEAATRAALARAGVRPDRVAVGAWDTLADAERFFSHRREGGATGRHWAWVRTVDAAGGW
jgi:YfiH family protein